MDKRFLEASALIIQIFFNVNKFIDKCLQIIHTNSEF